MSFVYIISIIIIFALAFILYIINRIHEKYAEDDPMIANLITVLSPIFPQINKVILLKGTKSYTINKKRIHLCLVDKDGKYYDMNMLVYVTLHELAHTMCSEVGHTDKFHAIFQTLLNTAAEHNVYNFKTPILKNYCMY